MSDQLRFGEILVRANVLDRSTLDRVAREWQSKGGDLGELLVLREAIDEGVMLQTIGKALNLPTVSLASIEPDERALELVPRDLCVEYLLVPVEVERSRTGQHLHVAMANPSDVRAIKHVTRRARLRIRPLVASAREIRAAIARWFPDVPGAPATATVTRTAAPPAPFASSPSTRRGVPEASLDLAPPPPPVRPKPAGGGADALFDFGVLDLSAAGPDDAFGGDGAGFGAPPPLNLEVSDTERSDPLGLGSELDPDLAALLEYTEDDELSTSDLKAPALGTMATPRPVQALHQSPPQGGGIPPDDTDALSPEDTGFGIVTRRRGRGRRGPGGADASVELRPSVEQPVVARREPQPPARADATRQGRPLPPLPPGLSSEARLAPERATPSPADRVPEGVINDRERVDVGALLDRYAKDIDESDEPEDELIATWLARYGGARRRRLDDHAFDELDRALSRVRPGVGRTVVALIRYLARRGLVDPEELLGMINNT